MDARFELLRPSTGADEGGQIDAEADRCASTGGGDSTCGAASRAKHTYVMPGQRIKTATDEPQRSTDTSDSLSTNGVKPMYRLPGKQRRVSKRGAVNVEGAADDRVDGDDEALAEMLREQEQERARRLIEKHRQKLSEARRAAMEAAEATRLAEQQRMVELLRKQKNLAERSVETCSCRSALGNFVVRTIASRRPVSGHATGIGLAAARLHWRKRRRGYHKGSYAKP